MSDLKEVIAQIKTTVDLADYIQSFGIVLKANGATKFKGLCPFHGEKTPSFSVDSNYQNYRCFGCGASGDIVSFTMEYDNLSFIDSVRKIADQANIEFDLEDSSNGVNYRAIRDCVKDAANFFVKAFKQLPEGHVAKKEITDRGLPVDGMIYGYAPEGRNSLVKFLSGRGYSDDVILQAGVAVRFKDGEGLFDFWHGRLMFVITDVTGKPVGFSGKKLFEDDKRGKYVNSPDGPIFDKSAVLFNQSDAKHKAKVDEKIYVTEGQFDVAAMVASKLLNTVAASGTAFTKRQLSMTSRMVGENGKIVFCFDGDSAGEKAALKVLKMASDLQGQCYVVSFPDGMDPCDFRMREGGKKLRKFLAEAEVPIVQFAIDVIARGYDLSKPEQVALFVDEVAPVLKTVSNSSLRASYARLVALKTFLNVSEVLEAVAKAKGLETRNESNNRKASSDDVDRVIPAELLSSSEKEEGFIAELRTSFEEEFSEDYSDLVLYARALKLCFERRELIPLFIELEDAPKPFVYLAKTVEKLEDGKPITPEIFKLSELAKEIINGDYYPYLHLMDDSDIAVLFSSLVAEISNNTSERLFAKKAEAIIAADGGSNDIELLKGI